MVLSTNKAWLQVGDGKEELFTDRLFPYSWLGCSESSSQRSEINPCPQSPILLGGGSSSHRNSSSASSPILIQKGSLILDPLTKRNRCSVDTGRGKVEKLLLTQHELEEE